MTHPLRIIVPVAILSVGLAFAACGDGGTGGGTTGTHTGGGAVAPACSTPAEAPSKGACFKPPQPPACPHPATIDAGAGGGLDCSDVVTDPDACTACELSACCAEVTACKNNADCWLCLTDSATDESLCQAGPVKALLDAFTTCANGCCTNDCWTPACNPVTNEGCDAASGEACDFYGASYGCYGPPNDGKVCGACDNEQKFCAGGATCAVDGKSCYRYCCTDADCGGGKCDREAILSSDVGVCVAK